MVRSFLVVRNSVGGFFLKICNFNLKVDLQIKQIGSSHKTNLKIFS